jgi:capsular polysaccharide transport system permease protein
MNVRTVPEPATPVIPAGGPIMLMTPVPEVPVADLPAVRERVVAPARRIRLRHGVLVTSFVAMVLAPFAAAVWYLFTLAADQYHSRTAFSVHTEDFEPGLGALAAFAQIKSQSMPDGAILYDFIQSQVMVERVRAEVDLDQMFNRAPTDFVFALGAEVTVEDRLDYWNRMVQVSLDSGTDILRVEVKAFTPQDAVRIAEAITAQSSLMVNELSAVSQSDATEFALQDLAEAEAALKALRLEIRGFRDDNQLIDPSADVQSQMGVVAALQSQLAAALVERAELVSVTKVGDQRLQAADRRISAIRDQIAAERAAVSGSDGAGRPLTETIGTYEELLVDLEFAQNAYTAALAGVEQSRAEARRQSRYLAIHIPPTLADESLFPRRYLLSFMIFAACLALWSVLTLGYYNLRDRA